MKVMNRMSKIISPFQEHVGEKCSVSLSQKLFDETNLTHFNDGIGVLMPLLMRSLGKLEAIIHKQMKEISALHFLLPTLIHSELFKTSNRQNLPDLFKVNINEKKSYILSPTCEESVCHLINSFKRLNQKHLPIRLYQISNKFRDEKRPRSGLLRTKEFVMKDLYCFDLDNDSSEECYQKVVNQYHHFFDLLKIPYVCARGSTGDIGGLKSHEFHFLSDAGQDKIILCQNCSYNENLDLTEDKDKIICKKCQSTNITIKNAIEVGHAFKLGTKFTEPFNASYLNKNNVPEFLHMSSFGLGLTRIIAASVEILSNPNAISWPVAIAPYSVCVTPPKAKSKEEEAAKDIPQLIYQNLNQFLEDDVIMDDRTALTIGKRLELSKKIGFPFQVIIGKTICNNPPTVEVMDIYKNTADFVQIPDINQYIQDKLSNVSNQKIGIAKQN